MLYCSSRPLNIYTPQLIEVFANTTTGSEISMIDNSILNVYNVTGVKHNGINQINRCKNHINRCSTTITGVEAVM